MDRHPKGKKKKFSEENEFYDSFPSAKKPRQEGDLEVTGVSRSGRVRKKSSKLVDFESPDEIESRFKRGRNDSHNQYAHQHQPSATPPARPHHMAPSHTPVQRKTTKAVRNPPKFEPDHDIMSDDNDEARFGMKMDPSSESDSDSGMYPPEAEVDSSLDDSLGSEDDLEDEGMMDDRSASNNQGFQRIDAADHQPAQSLYMLEKSSKKKLIIRDGKIVGRMKAQRKDKGKTRFTAYMLWAKEIRPELSKQHPDMDFAQISKRLGEMWATVPYHEKYVWKRRAKRQAGNKPTKGMGAAAGGGGGGILEHANMKRTKAPTNPRNKFINKGGAGGRIPESATRETPAHSTAHTVAKQQALMNRVGSSVSSSHINVPSDSHIRGGKSMVSEPSVGPGLYKVVGSQPVDVAAHLRLLGESLSIIGERLKEHEGQIAVSGSLSVLLDSLLCVLGPLLCLTSQVSQTNVCPQEMLSRILDNTAYIMPGL